MFLQGCQNLYAQMLLVLQAKCSINKKRKLLYLLQRAVMTVCKYILICMIFETLGTLIVLKGGWDASPVENIFFCAGSFTSIVFLDVVRKKSFTMSITALNCPLTCPLQQLGKYIHPRSMHMLNHHTPGFFFKKPQT